jgi:hypothetical protein
MKWLKRLLLVAAVALVVLMIGAALAWRMLRGRPDWYGDQQVDPAAQKAAAARAEDEIKRTLDWASAQQAEERARLQGGGNAGLAPDNGGPATGSVAATTGGSTPASTAPSTQSAASRRSLTVHFTEQELNAAFNKWGTLWHWDEKYGQSISDPRIVLHGGRVIVAGSVTDLGAVVSLHFQPSVQPDGRLRFDLVRVLGGRLPLPQAMFDSYRGKIEAKVRAALPGLQQGARIAPDGSANEKAVGAAMSKLLLRVLHGQADDAVLFLTANQGTQVPVKLTGLTIDGKSIAATVELMNARERAALLERIKAPEPPTGAGPDAAPGGAVPAE